MNNKKWIEVYYGGRTRIFPVNNITDVIRDTMHEDGADFYTVTVIVADRAGAVEYMWRYVDEAEAVNIFGEFKDILTDADARVVCKMLVPVYKVETIG